jgi:hypothetical protein
MRFATHVTCVALLVFLACKGKSADERAMDLQTCSALSSAALEIAQCLQGQGGWSAKAADSAANVRARELDSVRSQIGAMAERADSQHAGEVQECDRSLVDMKTCLITRFGWEEDQATAVDDSVWNSRSAEHQREITSCAGRRGLGAGACLQLHYKWLPRRALALDDSIRRANIN